MERGQHQRGNAPGEGTAEPPGQEEGPQHARRVRARHHDAEEVQVARAQRFERGEKRSHPEQRQQEPHGLEGGGGGLAFAPGLDRLEQALADGQVPGGIPEENRLGVGAEEVVLDGEGGAEEGDDDRRARAGHRGGGSTRTRRDRVTATAMPRGGRWSSSRRPRSG
jgi:hypothetical protein